MEAFLFQKQNAKRTDPNIDYMYIEDAIQTTGIKQLKKLKTRNRKTEVAEKIGCQPSIKYLSLEVSFKSATSISNCLEYFSSYLQIHFLVKTNAWFVQFARLGSY
jgi:hypothetical protein